MSLLIMEIFMIESLLSRKCEGERVLKAEVM